MQRLIKLSVISMVVAMVAGMTRGSEASMAWVGGRDAGIDGAIAGDLSSVETPLADAELPPTGAELLATAPLADDVVILDPFLDTKAAEVSVAAEASTAPAAEIVSNTPPVQQQQAVFVF